MRRNQLSRVFPPLSAAWAEETSGVRFFTPCAKFCSFNKYLIKNLVDTQALYRSMIRGR
jgi:hypothetical protein